MYKLENKILPVQLKRTTFADLDMEESHLEEILRKNIEMLCDEEDESMLIVGQQVRNEENGRLDLTAIDKDGDLVLIEIKRDKKDIQKRTETFEVQAIRYAASCATVSSENELIQKFFAPYVKKHITEFQQYQGMTYEEIARTALDDFLRENSVISFNERQKIILVASEFDMQTLAAATWLNNNHIDIRCYEICPIEFGEDILLDVKKLLPPETYNVSMAGPGETGSRKKKGGRPKRKLPKIDDMMKWDGGIVKAGDIIVAEKDRNEKAELLEDGRVKTSKGVMSMQQWLKGIYGWAAIQTYVFAVQERTGKTLDEIRTEYMAKHDPDNDQEESAE